MDYAADKGLLEGLETVVRPVTTTNTLWSDRYALRARGMKSSAIRELLKLIEDPAIISFAGGLPAPEVFPAAEVAAAAQRVLTDHAPSALQYGATEGSSSGGDPGSWRSPSSKTSKGPGRYTRARKAPRLSCALATGGSAWS